jgi:hypothetical protein
MTCARRPGRGRFGRQQVVASWLLPRAACESGRDGTEINGSLVQRMVPELRGLWPCQHQRRGAVLVVGRAGTGEGVWSITGLAHRENAGFAPDIFAWLDGPFVSPRPVAAQTMRMEEHAAGGRYVVRT